jgi:hypothetical protein
MSLLWRTAIEHGSTTEVPMEEFKRYHSGDFDCKVHELRPHMEFAWDQASEDYDSYDGEVSMEDLGAHSEEVKHGGARTYIEHLKKDLARNGQREPVDVRHPDPDDDDHENGPTLVEGHHRAVALMELGAPTVKVRHIR